MTNNEELGNIIDELARIETKIEELSFIEERDFNSLKMKANAKIKDFEGARRMNACYNDLGKLIDDLNKEYINNGGK